MRQIAGEPEELQLEREGECVDRRPLRDLRRLVEQIEEARQRGERSLVSLLLGEEPEHRLGADQADAEAVEVGACRLVGSDELDARDRLELARALVEHQLDVRERLEPPSEARLRLPNALGDGPDPAAVARVEVEHPVGLAEANRPEHDGLGLVGAPGHVHVTLGPGTDRGPSAL